MYYYSLNREAPGSDFREAVISGQARDKGLYFPAALPRLPEAWIKTIETRSDIAIGIDIMRPYTEHALPEKILQRIIEETLSFPMPLIPLSENIFSMELFHGPTQAFKDIGARFMSGCLGYFLRGAKQKAIVLTATSGDTGGAVAHAFHNVPGIEVVILYPSRKISTVQEAQITGPGGNINALAIEGTFDDCQALVKQAFADEALRQKRILTSANSINIARWLPQQIYYFLAWKQWPEKQAPPLISVPSGNFGNISAGVLAHLSGLPAEGFIAACNANAAVPDYLASGHYQTGPVKHTLSSAMDVSAPNNFVRLLALYHNQYSGLKDVVSGYSISDDQTRNAIKQAYNRYDYLLDPHGAVGFAALEKAQELQIGRKGLFLETAHPAKFLSARPEEEQAGNYIAMDKTYKAFKHYLLENLG
ncbi:threonine synthase [Taibaiella chishuiensis]|uniref:Threonine synthase n=1 Tax=Taibaiella chishuiensis TaxID=1434707 RepID=A0A2P8D5Q7_9BACT|nr:threonine synthase [Taibaiella chishuiensis]PSK92529.1 threonine synthase [Taibaiella chishuiensis]